MLEILFDQLFSTLNNWNSIQNPHLDLEATLFCLKSVSEEIPTDENEHISKLFESNTLELLASENNPRLQVTALALMGKRFYFCACYKLLFILFFLLHMYIITKIFIIYIYI